MTHTDAAPSAYSYLLSDYLEDSIDLLGQGEEPLNYLQEEACEMMGPASSWPVSSMNRYRFPPALRSVPMPRHLQNIVGFAAGNLDVWHAPEVLLLLEEARNIMGLYMVCGGSAEHHAALCLFIDQLTNAAMALESVGAQLGVVVEDED